MAERRPVTSRRRSLPPLVAALLAALFVATAVAISWGRNGVPVEVPALDRSEDRAADRDGGAAGPSPRSTEPAPPAPDGAAPFPTDPDEAEALGAEELLAAGEEAAGGAWSVLGHPDHPVEERPVYAGTVRLEERRRVDFDLVVAFRAREATHEVVLRLLPAARSLGGEELELAVRRDGRAAAHRIDRDGARMLVSLDPPAEAGQAVTLRLVGAYELAAQQQIPADAGPPSFGVLSWTPEASVLGHWLPLLTLPGGAGPMHPWGDIGAFPAAVWSLEVVTDARLISGGDERRCASGEPACVWLRGVALRELAAVAYEEPVVTIEDEVTGLRLRTAGPSRLRPGAQAAHQHALASTALFTERLGPLAWRSLDVAAVTLAGRAAGMEFPGLVLIDDAIHDSMEDGFGATVVAHEIGHQWFHALVGNGSLSDAVVDESVAQYLTYLYWSAAFGDDAGETLVEAMFRGPYEAAIAQGHPDGPPARHVEEFGDEREYGALVYSRAPLAFVAAEERIGRERVVGLLEGLVDRHALRTVDAETVLREAEEHDEALGAEVRRWWFEPTPN